MASIRALKDSANETIYPQTLVNAVFDLNNQPLDALLSSKIAQYAILPEASLSNNGLIVQYIGATTENYTQGAFYKSNGSIWVSASASIPTVGSKNTVTSEGIKNYIDEVVGDIETLLASI